MINQVKKVHFVGIKGVGMTPLALIMQDLEVEVQGSDTLTTQITDQVLAERNIPVKEFDKSNINNEIDLVIYSGAYKISDHPELLQAKELGIYTITQAEALASIINDKDLVAVCGVGGKTTTTAMMAQVFNEFGQGGWFVGVSQISNKLVPGKIDDSSFFVVEADEYAIAPVLNNQPKFSLYNPKVIICTNLAYDHPDIYPDFEATLATFASFFDRLPADGLLVISAKDWDLIKPRLKNQINVALVNLNLADQFNLQVIGQMNQQNAQAVLLACVHLGIDWAQARLALAKFTGTKRRLELIATKDNIVYLDDYGHHPDEVKLTLEAIKSNYPNKRLVVVFHPHTLSRTKELLGEFASSFEQADEILVAPIFTSAREVDDQSITAQILADRIRAYKQNVRAFNSFDDIVDCLKQIRRPNDVILTLGAGDIYKIHQELL